MQFLGASKKTVVPSRFEEPSSYRARPLTLLVLLVATAGIILANVSSEPVTADVIRNGERAYGWPLTWYWRSADKIPGTVVAMVGARFVRVKWPLSRYDVSALLADLAAWLVLLAITAAFCQWVIRRYAPRRLAPPRITTVGVLTVIAVVLVLANLSFDTSNSRISYGWPLIWYWYISQLVDDSVPSAWFHGWYYSALR